MDKCQPCRFFRGAAMMTGREGWNINCNFPRDGSYVELTPIPDMFIEAFKDD